jgi:thiol-disulfide isomerase/thioredoxin
LDQSLYRIICTCLLATVIAALPAGAEEYRYHVGDITRAQLFEAYPAFQAQYDDYDVGDISSVMVAELRIEVLFATWCHDSEREVPRLLKILETAGVESSAVELVALDFNKTEPKGRAALQGLEYTPTFVFSVAGEEIGRIVERPDKSLEAALANIVRNAR